MARRRDTRINKPLALFATFMIVVGVAAAVFLSSQFPSHPTSGSSGNATSTNDPRRLLLVNADSITMLGLDGTMQHASVEAFHLQYPKTVLTNGVDAANGAPVVSSTGFVSPNGTEVAKLQDSQKDGASVIAFKRDGVAATKQVLRENMKPISDASIVGWFNDRALMVVGRVGDAQYAYSVTVGETVKRLAPLPDNVVGLFVRNGSFWYVTAQAGEGIESPPAGPSELHRVSIDGADTAVAQDPKRVFVSVLSGPQDVIAYVMDDGQAVAAGVPLGKIRPLLFLPDGTLIVRDGYDLKQVDLATRTPRELGKLPPGAVSIFYADSLY